MNYLLILEEVQGEKDLLHDHADIVLCDCGLTLQSVHQSPLRLVL
jgi:hypothetical protein